ncbi:MAG: DUF3631 domain-containing protein [Gaiellaceae bacterium]
MFVAFDLLRLDGADLTGQPYEERRRELVNLGLDGAAWTTCEVFDDGPALFEAVCVLGLEGVVAKDVRSRYGATRRGWIKTKNPGYWRRDSEREAMQRSRERRTRTHAYRTPGRTEGARPCRRSSSLLLAIAELDGEPWATRARRAVLTLSTGNVEEPSLGLLLLGDIRDVFEETAALLLTTADLILYLARREESPWGEWWVDPTTATTKQGAPRALAWLLHPEHPHR